MKKKLIIYKNKIKQLCIVIQSIIQTEWKIEKRALIAECLNGMAGRSAEILKVLIVGVLIDLIVQDYATNKILLVIAIWSSLIMVFGILQHVATQFQIAYGFKIGNIFRLKLEKKSLEMDYAYTENAEVLDTKNTAIDAMWSYLDIDYVLLNEIAGALLSFAITAFIMISLRIEVFIIILGLIVLDIWLHSLEIKKKHVFDQKISIKKRGVKYTSDVMQNLGIGKEVRAYSAQDYLEQTYQNYYEELRKVSVEKLNYERKMNMLYSILSFLKIIFLYGVAVYEFALGNVTLGSFTIYLGAIQLFSQSLSQLLASFNELIRVSVYYNDYQSFMNISEKVTISGTKELEDYQQIEMKIEFENVWFKYPNQKDYTLKDINLVIESGEKIALIGENGSGKTTLVKLLLRLYEPEKGRILINGVDIKEYTYESYMQLFSPVFQDFKLLFYTIKENIVFDKKVSDERVYQCLAEVDLENKMRSYPEGLNSYLSKEFSEEGIDLSGGEKQRLAIAKALFKNAPIVVLDEPTASIDPISESKLYKKVRYLFGKNTILYISHRMSSITFCDKIIILEHGKIEEMGTYSELIDQQGLFWDMYQKQKEKYMI